jgi:hypothetical protein
MKKIGENWGFFGVEYVKQIEWGNILFGIFI